MRQAVLEKDLAFVGSMDPYLKLLHGSNVFKTPVCDGGGKFPVWKNFKFPTFHKKTDDDDFFIVQVWNHNLIYHDTLLGEGAVSLCPIRKGNGNEFTEFTFPIY